MKPIVSRDISKVTGKTLKRKKKGRPKAMGTLIAGRLSDEETAHFDQVSKKYGVSKTDLIRLAPVLFEVAIKGSERIKPGLTPLEKSVRDRMAIGEPIGVEVLESLLQEKKSFTWEIRVKEHLSTLFSKFNIRATFDHGKSLKYKIECDD